MAIYHFSVKAISRGSGRTATGSAAYRSAEKIIDERTGEIHDYTRKTGVEHSELILPGGGTENRGEYWNRVEQHHKRGDAVLAREVEVALPTELTKDQRKELAVEFGRELADKYGVAADVAIHEPKRETENPHAHIMLSACYTNPDGTLGKKAVELDPIHCQRAKIENLTEWGRERWADHANRALERAGHDVKIDHRSLEAQGIDREPQIHMGPTATAMERRGVESDRGDLNRGIKAENQAKDLEAERRELDRQKEEKGREYKEQRGQIVENSKGRMDYYKDREGREQGYNNQVEQAAKREQGRALSGYDQYKEQQQQQRDRQKQRDHSKDKGRGFER